MTNLGPSSDIHTFTADPDSWKTLKGYARANQRQPTSAEQALWQAVRGHQLGFQFRRQHAIERYIVDFVCLRAWLVVEVDGGIHQEAGQAECDGGRTHALQECGFLVLRFTNAEVLGDLDRVLAAIKYHLQLLTRHHPPAPSPLGEGEPFVRLC